MSGLIFDKRRLRTFHQPGMEWYFAIWKPQARKNGIRIHVKILPDLQWFAKAAEAGKAEIFSKYGKTFLEGIQIHYVRNRDDAAECIKRSIADH